MPDWLMGEGLKIILASRGHTLRFQPGTRELIISHMQLVNNCLTIHIIIPALNHDVIHYHSTGAARGGGANGSPGLSSRSKAIPN